MATVFDTVLTYQFIKKLTTPFNQMPAYRYGLIDDKGNFLKNRVKFTPDEKRVLGLFDIMVINLKKLIAKIPGGSTRLGTAAAALFLLRSSPLREDISYEELDKLVENEFNKIYNMISEDGAPVNAAGGGDIAGLGVPAGSFKGFPPVSPAAARKYKAKNKQNAATIAKLFNRKLPPNVVEASQDEVSVPTKKNSKNKTEIITVQNKVVEDTSLQYHKELNPKIWDDFKLKPEIAGKLLQIADAWIKFAKIPPNLVKDIIITGGNVNYNYTDQSDIDLHVVINRSLINPNREFVDEYLQDKKILWTLSHQDLHVYGYPVELYAQDINDVPHTGQGVYSVKNDGWIQSPQYLGLDFEKNYHLQKKVQFYKDLIDKMIQQNATDGTFDMIKQRIKKMRGDSIAKDGEFAFGNLVFKDLRNQGYLDKMDAYQKSTQDKALSLE